MFLSQGRCRGPARIGRLAVPAAVLQGFWMSIGSEAPRAALPIRGFGLGRALGALRRMPLWAGLRLAAMALLPPALLVAAAAYLAQPARQDIADWLGRRLAAPMLLPGAQQVVDLETAFALPDLFDRHAYSLDHVRAGWAPVPRLYFAGLPRDLDQIAEAETRKSVFLRAALPLVLLTNESILADRMRLERLQAGSEAGRPLAAADQVWLRALAKRYRLKTVDLPELLRRVDVIPPSLALAQAAAESGWGTSRPAREDNAIFGQMTWTGRMMGPDGKPRGGRYIVEPFAHLPECVRAYAWNLNTHPAYAEFRSERAAMRARGEPLDGARLATRLLAYSERGWDYIADVKTLIRTNRLDEFDAAWLDGRPSARLVVPTL